ncbi:MAG TPA: hypothetical protein VJ831_01600 [Jatrophihabitantaceae bacterium]|nr:hypothetical protein [Jatrophihabitantaceae bacterium]
MNETQNRSLRRRIAAGSAAVTIAGGGILLMGLSAAGPANADPNDNAKYFVCKFVGTPGVDETLQTGQNPISVSGNAIPETPVVVGSFFTDAQGRSLVLELDTTGNGGGQGGEPSAADCLAAIQPTPTPTPTPTVTVVVTPSSAAAAPSSEAAPAPAPVPGAVEAGKHSSVSSTSVALGGALMVAGAGGLVFAARRPRKRHTG